MRIDIGPNNRVKIWDWKSGQEVTVIAASQIYMDDNNDFLFNYWGTPGYAIWHQGERKWYNGES